MNCAAEAAFHRLIRTRETSEKEELAQLGPYAVKAAQSAGRVQPEPAHPYRTDFQRDRDRVLHSRAFRRLEYKTQVFVHHEGDHYRNRLTHTLEGAQIARTVARALRVNEDLAEAIALAHDLGHTPFGHAGERVLSKLMDGEGGFDHNRQSLRVVDLLEERYPGMPGLNLTAETREGILKHGCSWEHPLPLPLLSAQRSLEAQVANSADEVAYIHHDLDDGLRAGILTDAALRDMALWQSACDVADALLGSRADVTPAVRRSQILIALINGLVTDLIETAAANLESSNVHCVNDVRQQSSPLVAFSSARAPEVLALKRFLLERFYQHPRVRRMSRKAEGVVADLYRTYRQDLEQLPEAVCARARVLGEGDPEGEARAVADYVAGMTDRFALAEHRRLLDPHEPC
jgi:dGTPase